MIKRLVVLFSLITFTALFFIACRHDPLTLLSDAPSISFKNEVQPIITSSCTQSDCHGGNGNSFELITYADISGKVSEGKPHSSTLYKVITANTLTTMPKPPNKRLTDLQIKTIYLWIIQGAKNN